MRGRRGGHFHTASLKTPRGLIDIPMNLNKVQRGQACQLRGSTFKHRGGQNIHRQPQHVKAGGPNARHRSFPFAATADAVGGGCSNAGCCGGCGHG